VEVNNRIGFFLVYELLECIRFVRSYNVVISSLMITGSEMRETLKIDVYSTLSGSIYTPRLLYERYVLAT